MLDGSRSACNWVEEGSATQQKGLLPASRMPRLTRRDFVQNSNDNYWLTNPAASLYNFHVPAVVGAVDDDLAFAFAVLAHALILSALIMPDS